MTKHLMMCLLAVVLSFTPLNATEKPNVILINADDLGYGDLSCYGATKVTTPHIDRLAKEGMRFTDAHSASAVCSPSRYGLLTGQFPFRKNIWGPLPNTTPLTIDTDRPTLASLMKTAGYATAVIGKWHLGFCKDHNDWNKPLKPGPLELGFDHYFGMPTVNSGPPFVYVEDHSVVGFDPKDPFVRGKRSKTQVFPEKGGYTAIGGADKAHELYRDEYVATTFAEKAVKWIHASQKTKDQPFFMYLATTNIHHPFTPHPQFKGTSQCGLYGDFIHELDWLVGEVLKTLDELKIAENTMVIFTSDNGGMLNVTGQKAWQMGHRLNGDLLGYKFGVWEGGHRVPFLVRYPGKVPGGTTNHHLISQVDLLATLSAITGQDVPQHDDIDSMNQWPILTNTDHAPIRTELPIQPNSPAHLALRQNEWMYIPAQDEGGFQGKKPGNHLFAGAATQAFAGIEHSDIENGKIKADAPRGQLYDLKNDPSQKVNVYAQHPEIVEKMQKRLNEWKKVIPDGKPVGWINIKMNKSKKKRIRKQ